MPLFARLVLLVVIAVLPALAIQLYNEYDLRQAREAQARQEAIDKAQALADQLDAAIEAARDLLVAVAATPAVRNQDWAGCARLLAALSEAYGRFSQILIADSAGHVRCASATVAPAAAIADRPHFQRALASDAFVVGEFLVSRFTGVSILPLAVPIRDAAGRVVGVATAGLRLDWLNRRLARDTLPSNGLITVIDRSGTILARAPNTEKWVGQKATGQVHADLAAAGPGTSEGRDFDGVPRIFAHVPPRATTAGLLVAAAISRDYALDPIQRATERGVLLVASAGLVALLAAWIVGDRVIRQPIRQLIAATHDVSNGNYRAALPAGSAEFGALGRAFATMAATLATREAALRHALERNQALLREANHRIKNNLQLVSSLLGLQRAALRDAEARQALKEARRRIGAIARVHEGFYRTAEIGQVDFGEVLRALRDSLVSGADNQPEVLIEAPPPNVIPANTASPLALIANELVMNALKHAFPPGRRGTVTVRCTTAPDGLIMLTVADDGRGLPPGFAPGAQAGFGLRLVQTLTRQIHGEILVRPRHPGTVFEVRVPPAPAARA